MDWLDKLIAFVSEHPEIAVPLVRWIAIAIMAYAVIKIVGLF